MTFRDILYAMGIFMNQSLIYQGVIKYEFNKKEKGIHVSDEAHFIVCYTNVTAVKLYEY